MSHSRMRWIAGLAAAVLASAAADAQRLPVRRFTMADGLAHDSIEVIRGDRRVFLWFGTHDGLSRFDGRSFTSYGFSEGLAFPRVIDFLATADGVYLIAASGGGVSRFEPAGSRPELAVPRFVAYPFAEDPPPLVTRLFQNRAGRIWAGT